VADAMLRPSRLKKVRDLLIDEVSKVEPLRRRWPRMERRYAERVAGRAHRQRFLGGHPERLAKEAWQRIAFWNSAPAHFTGGLLLNLMGMQVVRSYVHNTRRAPADAHERFEPLRSLGVQRVPAMLGARDVALVRTFFEQHRHLSTVYLPDFSELAIYSNRLTYDDHYGLPEFKRMHDFIVRKLELPRLYQDLSGKPLRVQPYVSILDHKHLMEGDHVPQQDGNNLPHRDVFYPSYKIFIYLNDVTEDNAAFVYYPGTHKSSRGMAAYRSSLRYYRVEKRANRPVNALDHCAGSPQPQSQTGPAGTGVVFNVAGIHRRGEYKTDRFRERIVLLIDFRQNDAWIVPRAHRWKEPTC
jgi:Phytanoyl-CoA dioxygenase (PhyH)